MSSGSGRRSEPAVDKRRGARHKAEDEHYRNMPENANSPTAAAPTTSRLRELIVERSPGIYAHHPHLPLLEFFALLFKVSPHCPRSR
jgi:hypothetical protein